MYITAICSLSLSTHYHYLLITTMFIITIYKLPLHVYYNYTSITTICSPPSAHYHYMFITTILVCSLPLCVHCHYMFISTICSLPLYVHYHYMFITTIRYVHYHYLLIGALSQGLLEALGPVPQAAVLEGQRVHLVLVETTQGTGPGECQLPRQRFDPQRSADYL